MAAAAATQAGRGPQAAEHALRCFQLGLAQADDFHTVTGAISLTVMAGTAPHMLGLPIVEAAVAASPHAQPALRRAK